MPRYVYDNRNGSYPCEGDAIKEGLRLNGWFKLPPYGLSIPGNRAPV